MSKSKKQLVKKADITYPDGRKFYVNHKDGNKHNNSIDNLEWNTSIENKKHAFDTGLNQGRKGEKHNSSKLTEKEVLEIRAIKGMTKRDIAILYNIGEAAVGKIINRKRWTHI